MFRFLQIIRWNRTIIQKKVEMEKIIGFPVQ